MSPFTPYCLVPASFIPMGTAVSSDMLKLGSMGGDPLDLTQTPTPTSSVLLQKTLELFEPWFPFWGGTLSSLCLSHRLVIECKHRGTARVSAPVHTRPSHSGQKISHLWTPVAWRPAQVRGHHHSLKWPSLLAHTQCWPHSETQCLDLLLSPQPGKQISSFSQTTAPGGGQSANLTYSPLA